MAFFFDQSSVAFNYSIIHSFYDPSIWVSFFLSFANFNSIPLFSNFISSIIVNLNFVVWLPTGSDRQIWFLQLQSIVLIFRRRRLKWWIIGFFVIYLGSRVKIMPWIASNELVREGGLSDQSCKIYETEKGTNPIRLCFIVSFAIFYNWIFGN